MSLNREFVWMRPKSIHGGYNCDVSIKPLQSETYTDGVTMIVWRDNHYQI
jgi:hypothetical protein